MHLFVASKELSFEFAVHCLTYVFCRILDTMEKMESFIQTYFNELPDDIAEDKGHCLCIPTALKFPPCSQFSLVHSRVMEKAGQARMTGVWNVCETILGMWSEQDLTGFSDVDHPSPKPSLGEDALTYFKHPACSLVQFELVNGKKARHSE
jgi:hypothetical protein